MNEIVFRPDDYCPACGSRDVFEGLARPTHNGIVYIDGCGACQKLWERETRIDPRFEPCSNCAFIPGSSEIESGAIFGIINDTVEGSGLFYCHRRVPFSIHNGEQSGFDHKKDASGKRCTNARLCAGWLKAKLKAKRIARDDRLLESVEHNGMPPRPSLAKTTEAA